MDTAVQFALMSKAKSVFCGPNTFLSFPVAPLPYTNRQLDFFSEATADDLRQSQQNLQAFSMLVNLIPSGEAWQPAESYFLWDAYKEVLQAQYASSTRSPEEEAEYQRARAYLGRDGPNGHEDSPQLKAYNQYKDARELAVQLYATARSTGEKAQDEAQKRQWQEVDEPACRAMLDEAERQWVLDGYRNEVESAQNTVLRLGAKSPQQTWADWNARFNPDTNTATNAADQSQVYPSYFNPYNAIEAGAWLPFKVTENEFLAALNDLSPEQRARLGPQDPQSRITSLSFEFTSAIITRSWFMPDALRARFWRFSEPDKFLSDGQTPPSGQCPAYVSAIVFARKILVEQKTPTPTPQPQPPRLQPLKGFQFAVAAGAPRPATAAPFGRFVAPAGLAALRMRGPAPQATPVAAPVRPAGPPPTGAPVSVRPMVMPMRTAAMNVLKLRSSGVASERNLQGFQRLTLPPRLFGRLATAPAPVAPVQDDSIYILAFICKIVPKCPDPDPTLQW